MNDPLVAALGYGRGYKKNKDRDGRYGLSKKRPY
jgi:hypothetical protein